MAQETNKYESLWSKYRPAIVSLMRKAIEEGIQQFKMSEYEFTQIGNRDKSGYRFNLELKNGLLQNNIDGTAVARDLLRVLETSESAKTIMKDRYFKINLDGTFILNIRCN